LGFETNASHLQAISRHEKQEKGHQVGKILVEPLERHLLSIPRVSQLVFLDL